MNNRTCPSEVETVEEQIWINSYLYAIARLNPRDAETIADEAVQIFSSKWGRNQTSDGKEHQTRPSNAPFPDLPKR